MLEVCRLSPAPALLLGDAVDDWEPNLAARSWVLTTTWLPADWQRLAERVHVAARAGAHEGEALDLGVQWRSVPAEAQLLAWLMPAATPPLAEADEANTVTSRFLATMSQEIRAPMNAILGITHLAPGAELGAQQHNCLMKIEQLGGGDAAVTLHFVVSDSGSGVTPQHLERLFQPFEPADVPTSRPHGGTGLGLAIGQRPVQTMGGRLEVSSVPGQASSFAFNVVVGTTPVEAGGAGAAPEPCLAGERVLVVDDNALARKVLVELCGALGLQAEGAADGWDALRAAALAAAAGRPFDIVLVDAALPGMDGVACAMQLSEGPHGGRAIVLTSTAFARDALQQRLHAVGLEGCTVLVKPVLPSGLFDAIAGALGRPARVELADRQRSGLHGVRVLLVDDNEINQELASEILGAAGIVVTVAEDGRQAIEILRRERFDVVLMDCQMPVMDGYEATVEIRREPQWAALPIIAMTASVMSGDRDRALASGMNDHIAKPIDIDAMLATLARWIPPPGVPSTATPAPPPRPPA